MNKKERKEFETIRKQIEEAKEKVFIGRLFNYF
jgi:hypothetical protein